MVHVKVLAALLLVAVLAEAQGSLIESRLLGSKDTDRRSHTYHVAFTRKLRAWPFGSDEYVGSGAIVSHRWLLTSARVANAIDSIWYSSKVKAGLERLQWNPVQSVDVEKVVVHEFYQGKDTDNDIALVKVKSPGFALNEFVGMVSLATQEPAQNGQVVVTGWHAAGKDKKPLQEVALNVKERRSCGQELGNEDLVDETLFCVENAADRAVCANDYGSPAIISDGQRDVLVGIFSMTKEPGAQELCGTAPAVFTNIAYYIYWIAHNMS